MKKINKEIFILLIPITVLCVILAVYISTLRQVSDELKSVSAVVLHNIPTTDEEERKQMTVYITPSGKRYHLDGCEYLNEKAIKTTIEQAKISGYESCSYCQP